LEGMASTLNTQLRNWWGMPRYTRWLSDCVLRNVFFTWLFVFTDLWRHSSNPKTDHFTGSLSQGQTRSLNTNLGENEPDLPPQKCIKPLTHVPNIAETMHCDIHSFHLNPSNRCTCKTFILPFSLHSQFCLILSSTFKVCLRAKYHSNTCDNSFPGCFFPSYECDFQYSQQYLIFVPNTAMQFLFNFI
jgi:hypothetical protein